MTKSTRLSDLQLIMLSTAVNREQGNILPPPDAIASQIDRIRKEIPALLKRQLIEEAPAADESSTWRDQDQQRLGLFITAAGRAIIAADETEDPAPQPDTASDAPAPEVGVAPRTSSKIELVLGLLQRPEGATLAELIVVTGWLPHTTRAALTGLRKKGHIVDRDKRDDQTCYRIAEAA
jgi:hypothetical protein